MRPHALHPQNELEQALLDQRCDIVSFLKLHVKDEDLLMRLCDGIATREYAGLYQHEAERAESTRVTHEEAWNATKHIKVGG
jgi:hypothetical protein